MKIRLALIFGLYLLLLRSAPIFSQEVNVVQFSIPEGLPQSQVNRILFDSRGLLWVATSGGGIAWFDGQNFTTIDEKKGLAGNIVQDIEEGRDGYIYCASSWGGISVIGQNNLKKVIPYPEEIKAVTAIKKDSYGKIWIAGSSLAYLDGDELVNVIVELANPIVGPASIRAFGDYLFVCANDKIYVVDAVENKLLYTKTYDFEINIVYPISPKTFFIGTVQNGLFLEEDGQLSEVDLKLEEPLKMGIKDVFKKGENDFWLATGSGVFNIKGDQVIHYGHHSGMETYDCTSICFDAQGNAWLGTKGEGVVGIVNTPFTYYRDIEGLNKSDNFPIYEDAKGKVWVGNNEEGVFCYDGQKVTQFTKANGLPGNKIRAICKGPNDQVLVGGGSGLAAINTQGKITIFEALLNVPVRVLYSGNDSCTYVGTVGHGLWKIDANQKLMRCFDEEVSTVSAIAQDDKGSLYLGTSVGMAVEKNGKISYQMDGLINSYVGNIAVDRNGTVWAGTDREIAKYEDGKFTSFTESDGLCSGLVYILFCDSKGYLWVGTNKGLDRITLDNQSNIVKIKHFGYPEGFKGVEVNSKGVFENEKGEIYFSTIEGIHKYVPSFDFSYSYNTPVYLQDVKLFLETYAFQTNSSESNWFNVPASITLKHDQNHLTFDYFAIDFLNPQGVEYSYILEGFDKRWSPPTKSRYAVYNNLAPGHYKFMVKQAGNEFSQIAQITVYIQQPPPPFYKSIWFLLLVLGVFTLLVYYFTEYRTAKLRNQQTYLESKIEERTLEILESEKEKTVLLQEVHHRVKNNLQIIISLFRLQSHFTDNQEALDLFRNSQNRIRTMSKIHEKLYETKDLSKIEIKNYVMELIHDLVSSYDIKNEVQIVQDIENCNIVLDELTPLALIINEIITNSLKYGLKDVEEPKVSIRLTQNEVGITELFIADNGPGFDPEIWDKHESMGIELIKTLTEQLGGKIVLSFDNGHPNYHLKFKAKL